MFGKTDLKIKSTVGENIDWKIQSAILESWLQNEVRHYHLALNFCTLLYDIGSMLQGRANFFMDAQISISQAWPQSPCLASSSLIFSRIWEIFVLSKCRTWFYFQGWFLIGKGMSKNPLECLILSPSLSLNNSFGVLIICNITLIFK